MEIGEESERFPIIPLAVAAVAGIGMLLGILWLGRPDAGHPAPPLCLPPLGAEETRYAAEQIELGTVTISRWQNFLGQTVTYVDGTVRNKGPRTVTALELTLEFYDIVGQVVLRESVRAVGQVRPSGLSGPPLAPGATRAFRAGFEHIPAEWNRRAPRIAITGLLLQ